MTLRGAIQQLRELHGNDDIPIYVKPAISKVIETLEMDTQEVRHGRWIAKEDRAKQEIFICSVCNGWAYSPWIGSRKNPKPNRCKYKYCPNCGALMAEPDDTYCTEENCPIYQNDQSCERCNR